jgi:hypothetical protein
MHIQFSSRSSNTSLYDEDELASVPCEFIPVFGLAIHAINSSLGKVGLRSIGLRYSGLTLVHIPLTLASIFCSLHSLSLFRIGDTIPYGSAIKLERRDEAQRVYADGKDK